MGLYQGRALERSPRRGGPLPPRGTGHGPERYPGPRLPRAGRLALLVLGLLLAGLAFAHLPWRWVRERVAVVGAVRVEGAHYLDAARVAEVSGIRRGDDLLAVPTERARQSLLLDPRIAGATVTRCWPRDVKIRILEREPVLLVRHGVPWEVDSSGVLLAPLGRGVVADVPLLSGVEFSRYPAGTQVLTPEVRRGLAWVRALADHELQLAGDVSEVDVGDAATTGLLLMNGTRVLAPAWPPSTRTLSALRVVLADLKRKSVAAIEVDLRFRNQVIVRPAPAQPAAAQSG